MSSPITVVSVNISEKKGTIKIPVPEIELNELGVARDAHAGDWHRQVSLLADESVQRFTHAAGRKINYGEFAENITTRGLELVNTHPLDRLTIGEVELEITQIGKECHGTSCAIFKEVGNCVMPKEGIFARVIKNGIVKAGDEVIYSPRIYNVLIITLSDRASRGEYSDRSGPKIEQILSTFFETEGWKFSIDRKLIPDDAETLKILLEEARQKQIDIVITTGGTGIGPRDITPEVVKPYIDKEIPGIMELIRFKYGSLKPNALLSRAIAGVMQNTLIYTLPGSVKAVEEYLTEITPTLRHSIYMLHNLDAH
ncbi:MAG: molybdopterin-binding protein [Bacteroidales bacterium]|nr:molybdopterin-binding protein [Bacteroidales bacterium]